MCTGCSAVGSARRSGRRGRWFESSHPDQIEHPARFARAAHPRRGSQRSAFPFKRKFEPTFLKNVGYSSGLSSESSILASLLRRMISLIGSSQSLPPRSASLIFCSISCLREAREFFLVTYSAVSSTPSKRRSHDRCWRKSLDNPTKKNRDL